MLTDDFAETLPDRLRAALDQVRLPDPDWQAARRDLTARIRRRRIGTVATASAVAALMVVSAGVVVGASVGHRGHSRSLMGAAPVMRYRKAASALLGGELPLLVYGDGRVFAATGGGHLVRLDAASLKVTGRLLVGRAWPLYAAAMPVAYGDHAVWALDLIGRQLWRVDPATMRVTMRLPVGRASELAFGGGSLWLTRCCATGPHGNMLRLDRIDPATGRVTGSVSLPGDGKHGWGVGVPGQKVMANGFAPGPLPPVVLAAGRVIMVVGPNSPVFAVDPRTMLILRTFHVGCDGCETPLGVAVGPVGLYVTSIDQVVRLDLATGRVVAAGPPGGLGVDSVSPAPLKAGPGGVWLLPGGPCGSSAAVIRLDPSTLAVTARLPIHANGSVLAVGPAVYTSDYGGVVDRFAPMRR